jgi:hypothetical protein
MSSDL